MDFPVVLYFEEAQARLRDKPVEIPTLYSTALILVTQGASKILVPAFEHGDQIDETIAKLPPFLRKRVKPVDSRSNILRKVVGFVRPLREQVQGMEEAAPEQVFVRAAIPFLYQVSLGAKYGAAATEAWIHQLTHDLHCIRLDAFKGEARARLAYLASLLLSYRPFVSPHIGVIGYAGDPGIRGKLLDMLESTEFSDVVERSGHLGLVRRPRVALGRIGRSIAGLVTNRNFRTAARSAEAISALGGGSVPTEPLMSIVDQFERGKAFSPPVFDLSSFRQDIFDASLAEFDSRCKARRGTLYQIHVHQPAICGNLMASSHGGPVKYDARNVKYDIQEHLQHLQNCHQTAKSAVVKLSQNEAA